MFHMKKIRTPGPVWIVDTTLRDGEQSPGVIFSTKEKLEIASLLDEAGVDEIEAGIPAMDDAVCKDIKRLARLKLSCDLSCWCRAKKMDIELAAACNTSGVHISFPTSSILLKTFDKTENWVLDTLVNLTAFAKRHFDVVSVGAQDATRTNRTFLRQFAEQAYQSGAHRFRIADTVGMATPLTIMHTITDLLKTIPDMDIEFHGHNDLGMATANAVCAVAAGAASLSVTVNGIGERAGNVPLEEICIALFELGDYQGKLKANYLTELCRMVAAASGMEISASKPIVGKNAFRHESGIHCAGLIKNPLSYQPFNPKMVGRKGCEHIIGIHSGSRGIRQTLSNQGIHINKAEAEKLLTLIKKKVRQKNRTLSLIELKRLYQTFPA